MSSIKADRWRRVSVLAGLAGAGQGQAGGADVLAAVPGRYGSMPLARERGQERRCLAARRTDSQVYVLQRPLERELRGIVLPVHLVELGAGDRRIQWAV